jgi:PAS domain S-box-containing protein
MPVINRRFSSHFWPMDDPAPDRTADLPTPALSEARYRSLIEAASAIIWTVGPSGQFETEQPGWSSYTGQSFEQLRGWGWLEAVHPDDRPRTAVLWTEALTRATMFQTELRLRRADGQFHYMNVRAVPIAGSDGKVAEWIGIHIDIDERKRSEERLRLLDAMSEATRNANDPVAVMELTTRMLGEHLGVTRCPYADVEADNDRFTIRYDWTARGAPSTVGVYSLNLFGARTAGAMRRGQTLRICDVDAELAEHDGGAMYNAIGCKAIICCPLVKEGRLVAMMAVHQDRPREWTGHEVALVEETVERSWAHIERVRAAEALREEDRRKTEFLAILAHELRNPLAPIRNGLQVMRMAADDPATVARVRDMMERQVTQMVDLVDDLLDIARVTRGNMELKLVRTDLADVLASAVETSMPLIEANQHELRIDPAGEALPLQVDATRIAQVIGNVLNNAAKYTPERGRIVVSTRRDGQQAVMTIADNGIGIPLEAAESVFDMFSQVGSSIDRAHGGLGIGLSLARRLLDLHHGSIRLLDSGPERGSTFEIRLPLAPPEDTRAPAPAADGQAREGTGLRVLVVDDNADAADMLSALLGIIGHQPAVANDAPQALALAPAFRPDVAFLDIGMPGMNGYELAGRLRQLPETRDTVLIALTGWGDANDRLRTKAAGFDHHLIKPTDLDAVQALLAGIAARRA